MRRRHDRIAWAVSIALHLALIMLWLQQTGVPPAQHRTNAPVPRTVVRLFALPAPAAAVETPPKAVTRRREPRPALASMPLPLSIAPPPDQRHAAVSAPPVAAAAAALDLALPARPAASAPPHSAALDDPRSNSRRLTPIERFAAALGTDTQRVEERIADGMRVREGKRCVLVHDSHAGTLNPFNQSVLPSPKLGEPCP